MKKESPDIIYLQCGNEDPEYGVTWSPDLINKDDIEYRKSKQITIEELREQFETYQRQFYPDSYFQMIGGKYADEKTEELWDSYKQCAIDCGILKQ